MLWSWITNIATNLCINNSFRFLHGILWHGYQTKHTLYIMWSTPIVKASVDWYNESATPHGTILLYRYSIMYRFGLTINEQWGMRTYLPFKWRRQTNNGHYRAHCCSVCQMIVISIMLHAFHRSHWFYRIYIYTMVYVE